MFLTAEELRSVIYDYQLNEIVEDDNTIVEMAIAAAIEEVKSYLCSRYDVDKIFHSDSFPPMGEVPEGGWGSERNPLILEITKDIALWQIIRLSNPDILHDRVKDRYDRAIEWLDKVARGLISPTLPTAHDEHGSDLSPFKFGSLPRQTYDY